MHQVQRNFYAGVMGFPVAHSWSPRIFARLSQILEFPLHYRGIEVQPKDWDEALPVIQRLRLFDGWNVTLPYKERFYDWVDELSPEAKAVGAVNLVRLAEDGRSWGHNTDVFGILKTLEEQNLDVGRGLAVIYGAGGAALSVGYVLGLQGASEVWFVNRTLTRAQAQCKRLRRLFPHTQFVAAEVAPVRFRSPPRLYVNATPLGMKGFPSRSPMRTRAEGGALAFDLVYAPESTPFLRSAERQGLRRVGGLDMLLWQALASWEIWVGEIPKIQKIKKQLRQEIVTQIR